MYKTDDLEASIKQREYMDLLDKEKDEQVYQSYLEENTMFIPREFVQNHGIHFCTVFRKLPLSSDYKPDFVYLSKSSDNWNVILIEIEKPSSKYFKRNSMEFHSDFNQALQQVNSWRAWFDEESNRSHFKNNILQGFVEPAHMSKNPFSFKYVLVHGRRSEYENNVCKTSLIRGQQREDFSIVSFDSLAEDLKRKDALYVAVKKNTYYELISKKFIDDSIFILMNTDILSITEEIYKDAIAHLNDEIARLDSMNHAIFSKHKREEKEKILSKIEIIKKH